MTAPYYADELVTLYLGNSLEVRDWLAADVLVTDPPYGLGGALSKHGSNGNLSVHAVQAWDDDVAVRDAVLELWGPRPSMVFGSPARLAAAPPHDQAPLIWWKDAPGMGSQTWPWFRDYELIYVRGAGWQPPPGGPTRGSSVIKVAWNSSIPGAVGHPTPKPVPLMERLLAYCPNGLVADPFAGSGSTLLAARNLGRPAVGVELDERYAEVAARRLAQGVLDLEALMPDPDRAHDEAGLW